MMHPLTGYQAQYMFKPDKNRCLTSAVKHRMTPGVYEVNKRALGQAHETDLVNTLRGGEKNLIALVVVDGEKIVGHILFSPMTVKNQQSNMSVIGLAPLRSHSRLSEHGNWFQTGARRAG